MTYLNEKKEIWKDIPGFEWYYQASNLWNIKSIDRENIWRRWTKRKIKWKIIKWQISKWWYKQYILNILGTKSTHLWHRLTAITFIENPNNKTQINHIDGNKINNRLENLEWCTPSENMKHSFKIWLRSPTSYWKNKKWKYHPSSKKINQYNLKWEFIKTWDWINDAARWLWISAPWILFSIQWKCKTAWNFKWEYFLNK